MDQVKAPPPKVFYFGFAGNGHHMYEPGGGYHVVVQTPWGEHPDGTLCPKGGKVYQEQGKALLHRKDGWTALSFWDRSGDTRYSSNSNFFVRGEYAFGEMLALARAQFPGVFARMGFEIADATEEGQTAGA